MRKNLPQQKSWLVERVETSHAAEPRVSFSVTDLTRLQSAFGPLYSGSRTQGRGAKGAPAQPPCPVPMQYPCSRTEILIRRCKNAFGVWLSLPLC